MMRLICEQKISFDHSDKAERSEVGSIVVAIESNYTLLLDELSGLKSRVSLEQGGGALGVIIVDDLELGEPVWSPSKLELLNGLVLVHLDDILGSSLVGLIDNWTGLVIGEVEPHVTDGASIIKTPDD